MSNSAELQGIFFEARLDLKPWPCTDGILERRAVEELIGLLKHKISPRLFNQSFHAAVLRGDAQALIGAASAAPFRRSPFSIGHLANSDL